MSEHNKAIIQRLVEEVWTQGNLDVLDEIIHPKAQPPHGPWDLPVGPEGFKQLVGMVRTSVPNLTRKAEEPCGGCAFGLNILVPLVTVICL